MNHTVVLNSSYQVLGAIPEQDALCLITTGDAVSQLDDPVKVYRSQKLTIPAPRIIVLNHYVKAASYKIKPEKLTNHALFRRDNHTCQYCGRSRGGLRRGDRLEREHIIPRSQNGKDCWENVVTACTSCNHKKNNMTPTQAGMTLLSAPRIPVSWSIRGKSKLNSEQIMYLEDVLKISPRMR